MDPSSISIPKSSVYLSHEPDYWVAISDTLRHNGALYKLPFNLDTLKRKSKIGMMVKFNGDLHILLNDKDEGKVCGGIDIKKPLYGFVDLAGKTVKIRSMFYSGKLMHGSYMTVFNCFMIHNYLVIVHMYITRA